MRDWGEGGELRREGGELRREGGELRREGGGADLWGIRDERGRK